MSASADTDYQARLAREQAIFADQVEVHELPAIFHYWSNRYLRPWLEEFGCSNPDQFFASQLQLAAERTGSTHFVSIGCGNCDTEVRVARLLCSAGLGDFVIECLDINEAMLERGRQLAAAEGLSQHIRPQRADFNAWQPQGQYAAVMANQSLHHVVALEALFDAIRAALMPSGLFVLSDMIGRNGHQCWPEALRGIWGFWHQLPPSRRYNLQLRRQEDWYQSFDCSGEGFEGVRAQDILPLLIERFEFELFLPFGAIIDAFVGRAFGHHLDAGSVADREFVDRVHARDEAAIHRGEWTPTHLIAALTVGPPARRLYSRGLQPAACVRDPSALEKAGLPSLQALLQRLRDCGGTDEDYLHTHYPRMRATTERVLAGGSPRRVLDIGAHWLHQTALYATGEVQITAVDDDACLLRPEVQRAAEQLGVRLLLEPDLRRAEAFQQLPDNAFDLVLFTEIIEHLAFNPLPLWRQIHRVLAPGGRIVLTTPNHYALRGRAWQWWRWLRWRGSGLTIEEILGKHSHAHHWKEYSLAELCTYFRYLSPDFRILKADWLEDAGTPPMHASGRLSRRIERLLPWLRPGLYLEVELAEKCSGIIQEASW